MATEALSSGMNRAPDAVVGDQTLVDALASTDPAIALLALQTVSNQTRTAEARQDIEAQNRLIEELREQMKSAMKRAEEAQEDAGFWGKISDVFGGDIASICGVIATAAAIVGTGGAAAPMVLALVTAGMSITAEVGSRLGLDPKVCMALSIAGGLVGVAGGNLRSASDAWKTVASVANASQGGAVIGASGARVIQGQYEGDALDARADAKHAEGRQADHWLRLQMAFESLKDAARDLERSQRTVSNIESDKSAGHSAIIAHMGGAS